MPTYPVEDVRRGHEPRQVQGAENQVPEQPRGEHGTRARHEDGAADHKEVQREDHEERVVVRVERQPRHGDVCQGPRPALPLQGRDGAKDGRRRERQAHAVHARVLAVPDGVGADGHEQRGERSGPRAEAEHAPQPIDQRHRQHAEPEADEAQGKLAVARQRQPPLLDEIARHGMGFGEPDRGVHDVGGGAQAEEVAERLVAAQLLVVEAVDAQEEGQQQQQERRPADGACAESGRDGSTQRAGSVVAGRRV